MIDNSKVLSPFMGWCSCFSAPDLSEFIVSGEQVGIHRDVSQRFMDIWDGSHILERATNKAFTLNTSISSVITELTNLIVFLGHGKTYEALVQVHKNLEADGSTSKFYQPKPIKEMKFVSHSLNSITSFITEYHKTRQALTHLQTVSPNLTGTAAAKAQQKASQAEGYLHKIDDPMFLLNMYFVKDLLILLTKFSKSLQRLDLHINDYFNDHRKLLQLLEKMNLGYEGISTHRNPDLVTDETKDMLPSYISYLRTLEAVQAVPREGRTRSTAAPVSSCKWNPTIRSHHVTIRNIIVQILERINSTSMMKSLDLINSGSKLLNDLSCEFRDMDETVSCGQCGKCLPLKSLEKHHKKAHGPSMKMEMIKYSALADFQYSTDYNIRDLTKLVTLNDGQQINESDLERDYQTLKGIASSVKSTLKKAKLPCTSNNLYLYLFKCDDFERKIPVAIKQVILKLLTTISSEAICESYGSCMETYHARFKNSDLEDSQAQMEMFVKLVGPDLSNADTLINRTMAELNKSFVLSSRARFSNISKVLLRKLNTIYDFSYLDIALNSLST